MNILMCTVERGFKSFKYFGGESTKQVILSLADLSCLGWWCRLWNQTAWIWITAQSLTTFVTLGELLHLLMCQFLHLWNGCNGSISYLKRLWWILNEDQSYKAFSFERWVFVFFTLSWNQNISCHQFIFPNLKKNIEIHFYKPNFQHF